MQKTLWNRSCKLTLIVLNGKELSINRLLNGSTSPGLMLTHKEMEANRVTNNQNTHACTG